MKHWLIMGALAALFTLSSATVWGASDGLTEQQKQEMYQLFEQWLAGQRGQEGLTGMPAPPGDLGLGDTTQRRTIYGKEGFSGGSALEGGRTVYAKPFVKAPKTIVGGYIDFTITDCAGPKARDCGDGLEFDQERFVPFFYSQVTDRISVAAEVEIEHGGPQNNQGDGDIKIEFATMDYRFTDWVNFRAGIILIPMGRFNLVHDSPLNDLPLRPMVSRLILPSTFAESGIGLYGTFYPTQLSKVDYEFYVTQGFKGDSSAGGATSLTEGSGLRSSRGSFKTDNNQNKAIVSRVAISPILGIEVAGSVHHGTWDSRSNKNLTIWAVDGNLQRGPFEIQGEAAWVNIEGGDRMPVSGAGIPPHNMEGYYVQGNFHFFPDILKQWAPTHFSDASTFTAVIRWGEADTNSDSDSNENDLQRLTLGLNFRPVEDSVAKFSYTFNDEIPSIKNSGWQFSMATYF